MSGLKKTPVQILQEEMNAAKRDLQNLGKQREQLQQEIARARKDSATQVSVLKCQLDERAKKHETAVKSLKSEMRDLATQHHAQMNQQRQLIMQEMTDLEARATEKVENLRHWTQDQLNAQKLEYTRISQQQQQQINLLKRDIENINRREENRAQRAKDYLADLQTLIQNADQNLPHDRYAPGRLERIRKQMEAAQLLLEQDSPDAAIAGVQAAHFDLMDLEAEVSRREMEFELTFRTVTDAVSGLLGAVRKNRHIQLNDDDVVQEADFWTNGRYQILEDNVQELRDFLRNNKDTLSVDDLNVRLDELDILSQEQEKLLGEAIERIISAQLRAEMGDAVVEVLSQQRYAIKNNESGYANQDQRGAYIIKMSNINGTEIVTVISPDELTYQNTVSINTYNDDTNDDQARRSRSNDIMAALKANGLKLGETQCEEESLHEYYDVENLLKHRDKLPKQVVQKLESTQTKA